MDLSQVNMYVRKKGQDAFHHSVAKRDVKILQTSLTLNYILLEKVSHCNRQGVWQFQ